MAQGLSKVSRGLLLTLLVLALVFVIACGSAAPVEQAVTQQEAPKEVPKEVTAQTQDTVTKVEAAKEAVAAPDSYAKKTHEGAAKQIAPGAKAEQKENPYFIAEAKQGGFINMNQYADVRQRLIHQSSVLNMNMAPLFNNLIEYNPETADQGDLRCDLCESWELAEDGVTYTFHVHPDAKWWDGTPVTAKDVVFSLESMVAPDQFPALEGRSTSTHCNTGLYYDSGQSRAIDEKTVEVVTKFPTAGFFPAIANHTCVLIPEHVVVGQGIAQGGRDMDVIVGSGPFKFVEYVKEVSVEYTRNEDYFKEGRPYIEGMKHFVMTDSGRVIAAFKTGQILTSNQSIDNLTVAEALQLDEDMDNLTMHWAGPISMMYIVMNTAKAPFDQPEVRKAVNLAINPQPIIDNISEGMYTKGYPLPRGFWYSLSDEEYDNLPGYRDTGGVKPQEDLAEAKRLLASVGMDGPFSITLHARNCCDYPDVVVLVKQQLEEALGWDITIKVMESGAGFDAYWAGDYQFAVQGGSIFMNDPDAIFARYIRGTIPQWTGGGRGKYYAPEGLEALFDQQVKEPDQEKRKAIVHEMGRIAYEGSANPYIYWTDRHHGVEHRIKNFNFTYQGSRWEHVWCDPECK